MPKLKPESPPASRLDFPKDGILNLLHSDDEVAKTVKDYNERYLYWDEVKRRKAPPKINSESLWKLLKFSRNVKSRHINVSSTSGFDFNFNITDSIAKQLHRFDLNLGDVLEVSTTIPEGQGDVYMINAIMEEAIASSQLEGAATTRKVAKEMLRSERKPKNHSEKMILNNYLTRLSSKKHII